MGFTSEKPNSGSWAIAGIPLRAPLKPIYTDIDRDQNDEFYAGGGATTPTSEGSRIPVELPCPPPPRKRRATANSQRCNNNEKMYSKGKRDFFVTPPDLESVFIRRHLGC